MPPAQTPMPPVCTTLKFPLFEAIPLSNPPQIIPALCFTPLVGLDNLGHIHVELGAKYPVPEAARDTKSVLVISKMMR
jgi:hypothetical protein